MDEDLWNDFFMEALEEGFTIPEARKRADDMYADTTAHQINEAVEKEKGHVDE